MRPFVLLAAALLTALRVQAQAIPEPSTYAGTPSPEVVLQWLHAPDGRFQAWAAHSILVGRLTDLVPELKAQLERTTPATLSEAGRLANFRTTLAILDTLIQLDATVPAETLLRIDKLGYNAHTEEIVLLSRLSRDEADVAIRSFYKPSLAKDVVETRVAAQLLAQHPPKGFAAELLSSIVVTGDIVVHDVSSGGGFGLGRSSCCGGGASLASDDWPETGRYSFRDPPLGKEPVPEGETLFLSAPDPIYLLRTASRTYTSGGCGGLSPLDDAMRSHLVGMLLNGNSASPFPEQSVYLDIAFTTRESYRAQVQGFVDEQQENFARVATALTLTNLLTEEERQAAALHVRLTLQDLRVQPAVDLPSISFRPPVQWANADPLRE